MKKYVKISLIYALLAMIGGVFYREFTKWNGYSSTTMLGKVHTHLFVLGMFLFLILSVFVTLLPLEKFKSFSTFMVLYNIGLPLTVTMMVVRGITQVLEIPLTKGYDSMISGVAGIGHIMTGVGIILLLNTMRKAATN